ncbi:hypothetical protein BDW69DRAFT_179606 [Aspergillus filifer]
MSLNHIPVRVTLNPSWTALDLMQSVQAQYAASLPYELLDFSAIVKQSTSWPRGTTPQSYLLRQNIDPDEAFSLRPTAAAQITCSYEWPEPPDEILLESKPLLDGDGDEDGGLQLTMDVRGGVLNQVNADLVEKLARSVEAFSNTPDESLETLGDIV